MAGRSVSITLDKPRQLRYDLNAMAEIEERLGVGLDKLDQIEMKAKTARLMLWAGLIHEDSSLTPEQVGAMVDMGSLNEVNVAIARALGEAGVEGNSSGPKAGSGRRRRS